MAHELRDYQVQALSQITASFNSQLNPRVIYSLPTGGGKTVIFSTKTKEYPGPVVVTVHRKELVGQTVNQLVKAGVERDDICLFGAGTAIHKLGQCRVVVAMVQSMSSRLRSGVTDLATHFCRVPGRPLLLMDEIHHGAADSWTELIQHFAETYPELALLGFTATTVRTDGLGLHRAGFDTILEGPTVTQLMDRDPPVLRRLVAYSTPERKRLVQGSGDPVEEYLEHAAGRQSILFAQSVGASIAVARRFVESGISAEHIDSGMSAKDRAWVLQNFRDGVTKVLCNHSIVSEGFDVSDVACVILDRRMGSELVFKQAVGRAMRLGGKDHAEGVVLDCWGNYDRFDPEARYRHTLADTQEADDDDGASKEPDGLPVEQRVSTEGIGTDGSDFDPAQAVELELRRKRSAQLTDLVEHHLVEASGMGRKPFSVIHKMMRNGTLRNIDELVNAVDQVAGKKHAALFIAAEYRVCETTADLQHLADYLWLDLEETTRRYQYHKQELRRPKKISTPMPAREPVPV